MEMNISCSNKYTGIEIAFINYSMIKALKECVLKMFISQFLVQKMGQEL